MSHSNDAAVLDHSSHDGFTNYYAEKSVRPQQMRHFRSVQGAILRVLERGGVSGRKYDVLDVGCNAGGQCAVWAESGHRAYGLDINKPLLELAKKRAIESGQLIDYRLGTATALPWADNSMDVCIAMELLEHVADWRACLREFIRVVRPGGAIFISTSNALCPIQYEFALPGYSWYPRFVKRHYEGLASTTRPELAAGAKYPAVNWFTAYGLGKELRKRGFASFDRFDLVNTAKNGTLVTLAVALIRSIPPLRLMAHICTPGTTVMGVKP